MIIVCQSQRRHLTREPMIEMVISNYIQEIHPDGEERIPLVPGTLT